MAGTWSDWPLIGNEVSAVFNDFPKIWEFCVATQYLVIMRAKCGEFHTAVLVARAILGEVLVPLFVRVQHLVKFQCDFLWQAQLLVWSSECTVGRDMWCIFHRKCLWWARIRVFFGSSQLQRTNHAFFRLDGQKHSNSAGVFLSFLVNIPQKYINIFSPKAYNFYMQRFCLFFL